MTRRVMGMVVGTNPRDVKGWVREQSLKQGAGVASDPMPLRYTADPVDAAFYQAERLLRVRMQSVPQWVGYEPWFVSIEHAQVYVDLALSRASAQWNTAPVQVKDTPHSAAHYWGAIYLPARDPRWMRGLMALHELAHHMSARAKEHGSFHGARFAAAFSELLTVMYGPAVAALFEQDRQAVR